MYSIPGDDGKNWRKERLIEFASRYPASFDPVALGFLDEISASKTERVWWAFLYSTCYSIPSACALYRIFPITDIGSLDFDSLWKKNKKNLIFQSDRKYVGYMDKFVPMLKSFIKVTSNNPRVYIDKLIADKAEDELYNALYAEVTNWFYFGRFGAVLFIDTLRKCIDLPMRIDGYDWKNGSTTTSGLFNAFYRDTDAEMFDKGEKRLSEADIDWLYKKKDLVLKVLKKRHPDSHWDTISITRIFCTYRKLYKGTRYLGYYVDRQQEELVRLQEGYPEYDDMWELLWKLRKSGIQNEFLGELHERSGIQKALCKKFLDEGIIC